MGLYRQHLAPRFVDLICSPKALGKWRARCVAELEGTVVEVGFGGGRNMAFYPPSVREVVAIEPSLVMRQRAQKQIAAASTPVRWGGLDGQLLDLEDNSVDAAVVTFALCTIPDPDTALREMRRVVKPGGQLRVLEHGLAPDEAVARWQHRLNGLEQIIADGCQLIRKPTDVVAASGWHVTDTYQRYAPGPKPWCYLTSMRAN